MGMNWVLISFFSILLIACNSSADPRFEKYLRRIKSRAMRLPEPISELKRLEKFTYFAANNRPNPFQGKLRKPKRDLMKTSALHLDSLKLIGVLQKDSETWAIISRSKGKISSIKAGDFLEENEGRVIAIKSDFIRLENRTFVAGKWTKEIKDVYLNSSNSLRHPEGSEGSPTN